MCYVAATEGDARRGGAGRIRISSSRSRVRVSNTRVSTSRNTRINIYTAPRPWGVGKRYSSWRSYGSAGYIYGYVYYTNTRYYRNYPDRGLCDHLVSVLVDVFQSCAQDKMR